MSGFSRMRGGGPCEAQYAGKAMNLNTIAAIQTCNEQLRASTPCASECAKSPVAKACLDCKVKLRKGGRSHRRRRMRGGGPCEAQYAGKAMNLNTIAAIQTCNEQLRASTPCASECAKSPVAKACLDCKVKLRKGGRSRRGRKGRRSGSRRTRRH